MTNSRRAGRATWDPKTMAPASAIVRFAVWTILTLVTAIPMQAAPPSASIQVQDDHITVSGISPGGAVAIMCVGHEQHPYRQVMVRRDYYVLDDDHDGIVTVALAKPLYDSV